VISNTALTNWANLCNYFRKHGMYKNGSSYSYNLNVIQLIVGGGRPHKDNRVCTWSYIGRLGTKGPCKVTSGLTHIIYDLPCLFHCTEQHGNSEASRQAVHPCRNQTHWVRYIYVHHSIIIQTMT